MQYSLNKDLQHLKWQQLKSWTSSPDCRVAMDKQQTQYQLIPKKNGRCSQIIENSKIGVSRHLDSSTTTQMAKIMVQYGRPSCSSWAEFVRSSFGRTIMGKAIWENPIETWREKIPNWECLFVHREKGLFLSVYVDDIKLAGKKQNLDPMWKLLNKEVDLGEPTSFLDHVYLGCPQRQCEISKDIVDNYRIMFESRTSAGGVEKLPFPQNLRISSWSYDMAGHAKKCVERYCELANKTTQQLYKVSTPCIDDHHFKEEELKSVGELSKVCPQIVLKCLYLARIGRLDILWSVNKLAQSITKWSKACDKRLNRLISYIHHTCEYKQHCHVGNTAKQCRLGLFQDSDFAGDLEDSKSTSGGTLCVLGSHTFVPISWVCKKQLLFLTVQQHQKSSLWTQDWDWMVCLLWKLWDLIVSVLGNVSRISDRTVKPVNGENKHHKSHNKIDVMQDIDFVPSNVQSARQEALLYVFEDNEAVIKMIIKGRSPTMRHVSRTHRVALDWLFDRINLDPKIQIKYIDTKNQLADILTKRNFTRDEWNHLLNLFNISHFSSTACTAAMAKRAQQGSGEERVTAKSYDEFDSEDAFGRVVFNFIKSGEDLVCISRSWKICCKWR